MHSQSNQNSVGKLINTKRRDMGLTQFDLAEELRVSDQAVSKWERNLSMPSLRITKKLITFLAIDENEFKQAQESTPPHFKFIQAFNAYIAFGLMVGSIVLSVVATVLMVLDQIQIKNALIMLGASVVGIAIIVFDLIDDKNHF